MDPRLWIVLVGVGALIGWLWRLRWRTPGAPRPAIAGAAAVALEVLRHLLAVVVLPVTVAGFIPVWIVRRHGVPVSLPTGVTEVLLSAAGALLLPIGLALFLASLLQFAIRGLGTLAPWDPPRRLVVQGPYRFVRHPMISGVALTLFAEALLLRSGPHAIWAAIFLGANLVYLPLVEEPQLEARFGDDYLRYRRNVPGLLPRLRPWRPETGGRTGD